MFCGARAWARPEDIEGVYAHLFFVLLSVLSWAHPAVWLKMADGVGASFRTFCGSVCSKYLTYVLWGCMPSVLVHDWSVCSWFYAGFVGVYVDLRSGLSIVWRSPP